MLGNNLRRMGVGGSIPNNSAEELKIEKSKVRYEIRSLSKILNFKISLTFKRNMIL